MYLQKKNLITITKLCDSCTPIIHVYATLLILITLITSFVPGCGVSSQTPCFQICNALTYLARICWHPVFCHIPPQLTGCSVKRSHNIVRYTARRSLWPVAQIHQPVFCCSRSELGRREMQAYLYKEQKNTACNMNKKVKGRSV